MRKTFKVFVACTNANGAPDFFFCIIKCSEDDFECGAHYDCAKDAAMKNGYTGEMVAFDEHDTAGHALMDKFIWESASIFEINEE